jgi:ribosomal protein S27AE
MIKIFEFSAAVIFLWRLATINSINMNFRVEWPPVAMPKNKVDLEKIRGSLNTTCPKCGYSIPPSEARPLNFTDMSCPKCKEVFVAQPSGFGSIGMTNDKS